MPKVGNESSHIIDGLTVRGGLDADRINVGFNGTAQVALPNITSTGWLSAGVLVGSSVGVLAANTAYYAKILVPKTGMITDLTTWIAVQSGNMDFGIYDCAATTINKLWTLGSTAVPAANAWVLNVNPNWPVFQGQVLHIAFAVDNGTASVGKFGHGATNMCDLPDGWITPTTDVAGTVAGGVKSKFGFTQSANFPLPVSLTDGGDGTGSTFPNIVVRIQ